MSNNLEISKLLKKYISQESVGGIILFFATLLAVIVANSPWSQGYFNLWHMPLGVTFDNKTISMTLTYWIDDGLMALFFLMVGLEIKREVLFGELSSTSKASLPIIAAIGGMVVPALFYFLLNQEGEAINGFGIPMATDIAFALGILMVLGKRIPIELKVFLVSLAVVDDLGAVMVIALFYSSGVKLAFLAGAGGILLSLFILNRLGVKSLIPYLVSGIFIWILIHDSGIHATIAGVLLAMVIPAKSRIGDFSFASVVRENLEIFESNIDKNTLINHKQHGALDSIATGYDYVQSPLVRLEHALHPLSSFFIMPLFAFSNAGVELSGGFGENPMVAMGIIMGLLIGKPVGIVGSVYLAVKLKITTLPKGINFGHITGAGFLAGIGFTMSIFIAHLAFGSEAMIDSAKVSILFVSLIAAIIGVLILLKFTKKS